MATREKLFWGPPRRESWAFLSNSCIISITWNTPLNELKPPLKVAMKHMFFKTQRHLVERRCRKMSHSVSTYDVCRVGEALDILIADCDWQRSVQMYPFPWHLWWYEPWSQVFVRWPMLQDDSFNWLMSIEFKHLCSGISKPCLTQSKSLLYEIKWNEILPKQNPGLALDLFMFFAVPYGNI